MVFRFAKTISALQKWWITHFLLQVFVICAALFAPTICAPAALPGPNPNPRPQWYGSYTPYVAPAAQVLPNVAYSTGYSTPISYSSQRYSGYVSPSSYLGYPYAPYSESYIVY